MYAHEKIFATLYRAETGVLRVDGRRLYRIYNLIEYYKPMPPFSSESTTSGLYGVVQDSGGNR